MKIAMIGTRGIPARYGGFETHVEELSTRLVQRGHEVTVYNRTPDNAYSERFYKGVRIVRLPTWHSKNLATIVHSALATLHALRSDAEVVHYFTAGAGALGFLPRLFGKRVVSSVDGLDWSRRKWGRLASAYLRFAERMVCRTSQAVITDSPVGTDYYQQKYGLQTAMLGCGAVAHPDADPAWLERFGLESQRYLLFVGRLVPEKNVHHLIEAFERIETDIKLVVVGDDPFERGYVDSLKRQAGSRVVFTGYLYGEGCAALQASAYAFVQPTDVGGRSPVLLEAMAYGNCVLVRDTPENLEAIGDAGLSFSYDGDTLDLEKKLRWLIDQPDEVEAYRRRALQRAESTFQWDQVTQAHEQLYAQVLGRGEKQPAGAPIDAQPNLAAVGSAEESQ